ncbi:hypothetical protein N864_07625 [Intrasporangium chromatireducens Q5-1]|uniref:Uncharacterized protein n=1 Tax=Intrasporangium chromatireducens Q5-1 TaxID=584657 RepID=W9GJT4_9MICO|nr:hypothetical protein [Intrasporangium chromatireducens]EWT05058.1 hypothetical protein N864_07625 [Intrasporangium chromatireducens Q5-1]
MDEELRPYSWWLIAPDDDHLGPVVEAVRQHDWVVFAGEEDDPSAAPPVALTLSKTADGRMVCTGMIIGLSQAHPGHVGPLEITSRDLRRIPVAELVGRAIYADQAPEHHAPARRRAIAGAPESLTLKRNPGPKGHPDKHFQQVAEMYRRALEESPRAPIVWLTKELHADRSTVARWLRRARDKGFLGEATPGRAGESVPESSTEGERNE